MESWTIHTTQIMPRVVVTDREREREKEGGRDRERQRQRETERQRQKETQRDREKCCSVHVPQNYLCVYFIPYPSAQP